MPSFDLQKLQRLVDERNVASLALGDANERLRDERSEMNRLRGSLMLQVESQQAKHALQKLLNTPADDLTALSNSEILGYPIERRGEVVSLTLNINLQTLYRFIHIRDMVKRLEGVAAGRAAHFEGYAVVPGLINAVRDWGFNTADLGV
jgi:hypothetical protein